MYFFSEDQYNCTQLFYTQAPLGKTWSYLSWPPLQPRPVAYSSSSIKVSLNKEVTRPSQIKALLPPELIKSSGYSASKDTTCDVCFPSFSRKAFSSSKHLREGSGEKVCIANDLVWDGLSQSWGRLCCLGAVSRELVLKMWEITGAFKTKEHKSERMKRKQDPWSSSW